VVSFVKGVTPKRREAIINSSLLAQLAAKKKVQHDGARWRQRCHQAEARRDIAGIRQGAG
jgi:hypothetical protein